MPTKSNVLAPMKTALNESNLLWSWRGGLGVRGLTASVGLEFDLSTHTGWLTFPCSSSSQRSGALYWTPHALH